MSEKKYTHNEAKATRSAKLHAIDKINKYFQPKMHKIISKTSSIKMEPTSAAPQQPQIMTAGTSSGGNVAKAQTKARTNVGSIVLDIDAERRVSVQKFRGKKYVDIRLYYRKGDDMVPGKKGITLKAEQWQQLIEMSDEINEALSSMEK